MLTRPCWQWPCRDRAWRAGGRSSALESNTSTELMRRLQKRGWNRVRCMLSICPTIKGGALHYEERGRGEKDTFREQKSSECLTGGRPEHGLLWAALWYPAQAVGQRSLDVSTVSHRGLRETKVPQKAPTTFTSATDSGSELVQI